MNKRVVDKILSPFRSVFQLDIFDSSSNHLYEMSSLR